MSSTIEEEMAAIIARVPPRPPDAPIQTRERWPKAKLAAFAKLDPHALCLIATDGPVSLVAEDGLLGTRTKFGGNRGVWPWRISLSASWKDTLTAAWNKSPFVWCGVQIRVWLASDAHARQLSVAVAERMAQMAPSAYPGWRELMEPMAGEYDPPQGVSLLNGFTDLGADLDVPMLEMEIHNMARRMGLTVWDDDGLSRHLDRMAAFKKEG